MALFRRGPRLPQAALEKLPLTRGERLLTAALDVRGEPVGVSKDGLLLGGERVPWHHVLQASWDVDRSALTVTTAGADVGGRRNIELPEPGRVPEAVRERVQASIAASRRVPIVGERGVLVAARRPPGSAELVWQVRPDPGVDLTDPLVRQKVDGAVAELRRSLGL